MKNATHWIALAVADALTDGTAKQHSEKFEK
jgi:hypothetical protein